MLADCHIYENHVAGVEEQMARSPRTLPSLEILAKEGKDFSIMDWEHTDIKLENYNPHPRIDFGPVAV
jgi:thymidylate synthase